MVGLFYAALFERLAEPLMRKLAKLVLHVEYHYVEDHIPVAHLITPEI